MAECCSARDSYGNECVAAPAVRVEDDAVVIPVHCAQDQSSSDH